MEQLNLHKQKLYALIAAGLALIALILPWISFDLMGYSSSVNGFRGWGLLSFLGVIAVGVFSLLGNKSLDYTSEYKKYVLIAFGAIALGALLFLVRKNSMGGGGLFGNMVRTGIGLWICLLAGLAGFAIVYGIIKLGDKKVS